MLGVRPDGAVSASRPAASRLRNGGISDIRNSWRQYLMSENPEADRLSEQPRSRSGCRLSNWRVWIGGFLREPKPRPTRPEAIRRLIELGLKAAKGAGASGSKPRRKS